MIIDVPISLAIAASSCSGRGSIDRQSRIRKTIPHQSTNVPTTRQRDQRHSRPSAGTTGQSWKSASAATRLGRSGSPGNDSHIQQVAVVAAMRHDRPMRRSDRRVRARRLSAQVTGVGGGGGSRCLARCLGRCGRLGAERRAHETSHGGAVTPRDHPRRPARQQGRKIEHEQELGAQIPHGFFG